MDAIKNKEDEITRYKVERIEKVSDFVFVVTTGESFLIDKEGNIYDLGDYQFIKDVYPMGNELFAVLVKNRVQYLINIVTKDVVYSMPNYQYSGIQKIDDSYVKIIGGEMGSVPFHIHTKKMIQPKIDLKVDFRWQLASDLFLFRHEDFTNKIFKNIIVNPDGEITYDCGPYYPYYDKDKLLLSKLDEGEVVVVHDFKNPETSKEILKKNEKIQSNPLIHTDVEGKADSICFVRGQYFTIVDFDMNVCKEIPLDIDYDDVSLQLWGDIAVIIVKKEDNSYCVALNLKNDVQICHTGIWILPFDYPGEKVIRGCDKVGDSYVFTLYDEEGNVYTQHSASDCFNVHSSKINKYIFYNVDGTKESLVFAIDTRKEKIIPWRNPEFHSKEFEYMDVGYGIRYCDTLEDKLLDFFDEDFTVLFKGIPMGTYNIKEDDFHYEVKNNLLLLTIPYDEGPKTYWRNVVFDKNKNKIYDSFGCYLSFIGNYLQIVDSVECKTYYIDSRTCEKREGTHIFMQNSHFAIGDKKNEKIKRIIQNKGISNE